MPRGNFVIPAKAGIQRKNLPLFTSSELHYFSLDSGFRRNDEVEGHA